MAKEKREKKNMDGKFYQVKGYIKCLIEEYSKELRKEESEYVLDEVKAQLVSVQRVYEYIHFLESQD